MRQSIVAFFLIFLLISCEKSIDHYVVENPADMNPAYYSGTFRFTTIIYTWMWGNPSTWDTVYQDGSIRKYAIGDASTDMSSHSYPTCGHRRLTINFYGSRTISPEIGDSGKFVYASAYHYYHKGEFSGSDSVSFYVGGMGGNGGGSSYTVTGVRIDNRN
jgi:hypothetical protein